MLIQFKATDIHQVPGKLLYPLMHLTFSMHFYVGVLVGFLLL
jgi:hypothetical protein